MTRHREPTDALSTYVEALVGIGGQLVTTIDGMRRYPYTAPDADSIPVVLTRLLQEIVAAELDVPPGDFETSAAVIEATAKAIEANLFAVDPGLLDEPLNGKEPLH